MKNNNNNIYYTQKGILYSFQIYSFTLNGGISYKRKL